MARRRRVVLLIVAVVTLLTATSGYTVVTGERNVGVEVVSDDDAYVGFSDAEPTVTAGESRQTEVLEVQNRFGAIAGVRLAAADTDSPVDLSLPTGRLPVHSGGTISVEGTVACDRSVDAPHSVHVSVTLSVDSRSAGAQTRITRQVTVHCRPPQGVDNERDAGDDEQERGDEREQGDERENGSEENGDERENGNRENGDERENEENGSEENGDERENGNRENGDEREQTES